MLKLMFKMKYSLIYIGCLKESGSYMWIYVFMGNMLRGIGETPIVPLGISYIDDFAKEGHSSLYLGNVHKILNCMITFPLSTFEIVELLNLLFYLLEHIFGYMYCIIFLLKTW